jgi:hypothetical protein
MSAGLPGLGLGGLFFILSALVAPAFELVRMARGRSSRERRLRIARQFALAVAMVIAIDLSLRALLLAGLLLGATSASPSGTLVLPLAPIGITSGLLVLILAGAKLAELATRPRGASPGPSRQGARAGGQGARGERRRRQAAAAASSSG